MSMWSDERALIEALIEVANHRVTHDPGFLLQWRDTVYGLNPDPLTEEQARAALDWLSDRLDMPVNPDA